MCMCVCVKMYMYVYEKCKIKDIEKALVRLDNRKMKRARQRVKRS